jgi:Fuc2NAc and GlcNAc transferase
LDCGAGISWVQLALAHKPAEFGRVCVSSKSLFMPNDKLSMNLASTTLPLLITLPLSFLLAWTLTAAVRNYAVRSNLMDHPNERSSHVRPTPRGGGMAIVGACLASVIFVASLGGVSWPMAAAICGGGAVVAVVGFADDCSPLGARTRFAGHLLAACWVAWWLGPLPALPALGLLVPLGVVGPVLAVLFIAWSINLFNFMDGIDGIASVESVTVGVCGALLWALTSSSSSWLVAALLACSTAGFLIWNFPPARIFMGDAGSGFLGLMVAALALWAGAESPVLFWSWLILYGSFVVDATITLIRRVRRGEKFHVAHRSHAYQYASRRFGSHLPVTLAIGAINLFWLLPIAAMVAFGHLDGLVGVVVAYTPLIVLAFHFKAGDRKAQETV